MLDANVVEGLCVKWSSMVDHLDERARRRWAASEAIAIGRGNPQSLLRWTCKSINNLVEELRSQGFQVRQAKVRKTLKTLSYSLQGNRKTREG